MFFATFDPAYRRLEPAQREFVDGFIAWVEGIAVKSRQTLSEVLARPLPPNLDGRTQAFLRLELVAAAIGDRVREIDEKNRLSDYSTLRTLQNLMSSNMANYMDVDDAGNVTWKLDQCSPDQMEAIKGFKHRKNFNTGEETWEIVLHDKVRSTELMMKYQNLLDDGGEHWRKSKRVDADSLMSLPVDASIQDAADIYARAIE